jgi:hypothetical protein
MSAINGDTAPWKSNPTVYVISYPKQAVTP